MISPDIQYLVGGIPTTLKNISQLGLLFPTEWKNKRCSKPPTRYIYIHIHLYDIISKLVW